MAVVKSRIAGMMAVDIKPRLFYRGLEIFHIATVGGQAEFDFDWSLPALHGVGTFLVAGLWLLWKQGRLPADEIVLTSELEARGFYAALGFQMRPPFLYVLKRPSASLLSSIVALLRSSLRLEQKTLRELSRLIQTEIGRLASRTWLACADKVIIEINRHHSNRLRELADIFHIPPPPRRSPINVHTPLTKIGWPYAQVNSDKVMGILESDEPDQVRAFSGEDDLSRKIAGHVIRFLLSEKQAGRIPKEFFSAPGRGGVGNTANAVLAGLGSHPDIPPFYMYSEVFQDAMLELLAQGKLLGASATALTVVPEKLKELTDNMDYFGERIVLRPQEISNHPGIIRRLGVIAMNTALEIDIYGNVNSSHVLGTQIMNGVGGSGEFTRNSHLSIFMTPSIAKQGRISSVVPMTPMWTTTSTRFRSWSQNRVWPISAVWARLSVPKRLSIPVRIPPIGRICMTTCSKALRAT